jgi:hypothetical protein
MKLRSTLIAALCVCAYGQVAPRAAPSEYQTQAKAGAVTIAAEFKGHSVPTLDSIFTTEDFVVVEAALYGAADSKLTFSIDDFSLRVNGKKVPLPSLPTDFISRNVKDPEWAPPAAPESKKSKTQLNTGGGGGDDSPPPIVHVPIEVQRAMIQKVQKAAMAQGERPLPQAGLLFFQFGGDVKKIKSIELVYSGPAGKATLALQP